MPLSIFEKAPKRKLRFNTPAGIFSSEDLWDLPLTGNGANLDDIAKQLHRAIDKKARKEHILDLMARQRDAIDGEKSMEDLQKELDEL